MYNKVILIGNLGFDPQIKSFENGGKIATIKLATTDSYKNKAGEKVKETEWHSVVMRGNLADLAEKYMKKGDRIQVDGKIKTRSYTGKDGGNVYITEIVALSVVFLPIKKEEVNQKQEEAEQSQIPY